MRELIMSWPWFDRMIVGMFVATGIAGPLIIIKWSALEKLVQF